MNARLMKNLLFLFALVLVGMSMPAFAADSGQVDGAQAPVTLPTSAVCPAEDALNLESVGKGGPPAACCDPDLEPGGGTVPFCFEGHTCCADGHWSCNNADGSPSCDPGVVCPEGCAGQNESCSVDEDCCSNNCRPNGRCK